MAIIAVELIIDQSATQPRGIGQLSLFSMQLGDGRRAAGLPIAADGTHPVGPLWVAQQISPDMQQLTSSTERRSGVIALIAHFVCSMHTGPRGRTHGPGRRAPGRIMSVRAAGPALSETDGTQSSE